jgi:hypothetical protein
MHLSAMKWAFALANGPDQTKESIVEMIVKGLMRSTARPKKTKQPITFAQVEKICKSAKGEKSKLARLRRRAVFLLGFTGFLRSDEIKRVNRENVYFHDENEKRYMVLAIEKSKCDQLRDGKRVHIAAGTTRKTCPVRTVQKMMRS